MNAAKLPSEHNTIGGAFDIYYGMKELHSRDGMADGKTLIISPTESYNGTDGWLDFDTRHRAGVCNRCADWKHRRSVRSA